MRQFERRREIRKTVYSTASIAVLAVAAILLARSVWTVYKSNKVAADKLNESRRELDALKARKAELDAQIAEMKTDRGAEEEVRTKFQVARPGEETMVIVDNPADGSSTPASAATTSGGGIFNSVRKWFER
jgi:cell division protein FtsB